jgi:putative Holliday junction resolvase
MGQILAVDYGTRRVGVAVSDEQGSFAMPLETLVVPARSRAAAVASLAAERGVSTVVVGRPKRQAGEDSGLWPEIEKFARSLRARGLTVVFEDEAYTSAEAHSRLGAKGKAKGQKGRVDALAASLILKQYLDRVSRGPS